MSDKIDNKINCSFCGVNQNKTDLLIEGSDAYICKNCIIKSYSVIDESSSKVNFESFKKLLFTD